MCKLDCILVVIDLSYVIHFIWQIKHQLLLFGLANMITFTSTSLRILNEVAPAYTPKNITVSKTTLCHLTYAHRRLQWENRWATPGCVHSIMLQECCHSENHIVSTHLCSQEEHCE